MSNPQIKAVLFSFLVLIIPLCSSCRISCDGISVLSPFGIDAGCGLPEYALDCSSSGGKEALYLVNPPIFHRIRFIDYSTKNLFVDLSSTCSPITHAPARLLEFPNMIRPSSQNVLALLYCNGSSPSCLADFAGHSCNELYRDCDPFASLLQSPCCFARIDELNNNNTIKILGCKLATSVYNRLDSLSTGLILSYDAVVSAEYYQCKNSGGRYGFDQATLAETCLFGGEASPTTESGDSVESKPGGKRSLLPIIISSITCLIGSPIAAVLIINLVAWVKPSCFPGPDDQGNKFMCILQLCVFNCCRSSSKTAQVGA